MTYAELRRLFGALLEDERFVEFIGALEQRFGALHRSTFIPGDPYSTVYNEGARSVIVFLRKLEKECRDVERADGAGDADPDSLELA